MLAVVEDEQDLFAAKVVRHGRRQRPARFLMKVKREGQGRMDQARLREGRQLDQPDAVDITIDQSAGGFKGEPGLSGTAGPRQRDQPGVADQRAHLANLPLAPNKTGERVRKVGPTLHSVHSLNCEPRQGNMPEQLRMYTIKPGEMGDWLEEWGRLIAPLRRRHGFEIVGAWTTEADQFIWILRYAGPRTWEQADAGYYASPDRAAMQPDPARHIAKSDQWLMSVAPTLPSTAGGGGESS